MGVSQIKKKQQHFLIDYLVLKDIYQYFPSEIHKASHPLNLKLN